MFGIPIEDVTYSALVSFLETGVREGFALDFKIDFPSNLEKTLSAFANTYGGVILIGVDETTTCEAKFPIRGVELKPGLRERVLQIAMDAITPPMMPEVRVLEFRSNESLTTEDRAVVLVRVIESDNAPHAIDGGTTVYLRIDNVSKRFERKATIGELEWLANKRTRSLTEKARLLDSANQRTTALRSKRRNSHRAESYNRKGAMRLWTVPMFPRWPLVDKRELNGIVSAASIRVNTAFYSLPDGQMQRVAGGISYSGSYGYSEFQQQGLIFHEFDYWWDYYGISSTSNARRIYPKVTSTLLWAVLQLSRRVYQRIGYSGFLEFRFEADDLSECFFADQETYFAHEGPRLVESEVSLDRQFTVAELEDGLMKIAQDCQRELYWTFGVDANDSRLSRDFLDYE
ncbi:MAG TPA: ATP-binding protein [Acidobacteriaceae bacterium]|jgi:hypothetical protein|nr:ATP-binding protein [Acidobacteriaceae bacterium]